MARKTREYYENKIKEFCVAEGYGEKIRCAQDAFKPLNFLEFMEEENFVVITLSGAYKIKNIHTISKGILNRCIVHPREVFFPAIQDKASAIIVAHNHPSGQQEPSEEDKNITKRLAEAGEILGISLLDHIIVTKNNTYFSFNEDGIMPKI